MRYYIADMHFGHKNILDYDDRPWTDIDKMEEDMISLWNRRVKKNDEVYILGDLSFRNTKKTQEIIDRLNGKKFLITGNHDKPAKLTGITVADHMEIDDGDKHLILSHYPMIAYNGDHDENTYMFYGHIHKTREYASVLSSVEHMKAECKRRGYDYRGNLRNCWCGLYEWAPATAGEIIKNGDTSVPEKRYEIVKQGSKKYIRFKTITDFFFQTNIPEDNEGLVSDLHGIAGTGKGQDDAWRKSLCDLASLLYDPDAYHKAMIEEIGYLKKRTACIEGDEISGRLKTDNRIKDLVKIPDNTEVILEYPLGKKRIDVLLCRGNSYAVIELKQYTEDWLKSRNTDQVRDPAEQTKEYVRLFKEEKNTAEVTGFVYLHNQIYYEGVLYTEKVKENMRDDDGIKVYTKTFCGSFNDKLRNALRQKRK